MLVLLLLHVASLSPTRHSFPRTHPFPNIAPRLETKSRNPLETRRRSSVLCSYNNPGCEEVENDRSDVRHLRSVYPGSIGLDRGPPLGESLESKSWCGLGETLSKLLGGTCLRCVPGIIIGAHKCVVRSVNKVKANKLEDKLALRLDVEPTRGTQFCACFRTVYRGG